MSEAAARDQSAATLRWPIAGARAFAGRAAADPVTAALVALLVAAWLIEGGLSVAGIPRRAIVVIDLSEVCLSVLLAARLIHSREFGLVRGRSIAGVSVVVGAYVLWVAAGLITDAPAAAVITSTAHFLILPILALLVASQASTERRARAFAVVLVALAVFEFAVTIGQWIRLGTGDLVVGSFGTNANPAVATAVLLTVCVLIGGYLAEAPRSGLGLALAGVLPLWAAWGFAKASPVLLPVVAAAVVVPALAFWRATWRRALVSLAVVILSSALVLAEYAVFYPNDFAALTSKKYLRTAHANNSYFLSVGRFRLASYTNASLSVSSALRSIRASNVAAGDYTVWVASEDGYIPVVPHRQYVFWVDVKRATPSPQRVQAQIEWRDSSAHKTLGEQSSPPRVDTRFRRLVVSGRAPARANFAVPKVAVFGRPSLEQGSATYIRAPHFKRGASGAASGRQGPGPTKGSKNIAPNQPVPGRLTQWRWAAQAISSSFTNELFGLGTGAATVSENLGLRNQDLSPKLAAVSESDFGTLLVERGWIGVLIVVILAAGIVWTAIRTLRFSPSNRWTTAFTLAVPGAVCLMMGYGMIGDLLRNRPAALTFWLIIALGLSSGISLAGRLRRGGPSRASGASAPPPASPDLGPERTGPS